MISMKNIVVCAVLLSVLSCRSEEAETASNIINTLENQYVPDKRVAVFSVEAVEREGELILRGKSNLPKIVDSLKAALAKEHINFLDSIRLLPDEELEGRTYGVVKLSVANLRAEPKHSAELVTQATLGTPLTVLEKKRSWYRVQTPDEYIAWVDNGGISTMTRKSFDQWHSSEKVIFLEPTGFSYLKPEVNSQTVSDLVSGNILEHVSDKGNFYQVRYPDSTLAYVLKTQAEFYSQWIGSLNPSGESLVKQSKVFMGVPYLWGGTSVKGVDCSGFTKTVYFLNGMIIPRDASQQVHTGVLVDSTRAFEKLQPGDLLFFGRPATATRPERVVHVGMWIGNNEFIHSAGSVHISSMDSSAKNFDEYNYRRYLRSKRLLQQHDEKLIRLTENKVFVTTAN